MTPLEWVNEAITRHTIARLDKRIDGLKPQSEYGRGADWGLEVSHEGFLHELHQLKELLVSRPPLTAKEASD